MTNEGLKKIYNEKIKNTLKKIQDAIDYIQEDNRIVTKKELIDITGLSSGTFSRPYVKELLEKNQVCQYRNIKTVKHNEKESQNKDDLILKMNKDINSLESKLQDCCIQLEKKENDYNKLKNDYDNLEKEHILLRGKYQQVLEYLDVLGADLSKMPLI